MPSLPADARDIKHDFFQNVYACSDQLNISRAQQVTSHTTFVQTGLRCPVTFGSTNHTRYFYEEAILDFANSKSFTMTKSNSSVDSTDCALKGVNGTGICKKRNGKTKHWMTFRFRYGKIEIKKIDSFFDSFDSSSDITSSYTSTSTDYSSYDIQHRFAVRAIFFRVRGASKIIIKLRDVINPPVCQTTFSSSKIKF